MKLLLLLFLSNKLYFSDTGFLLREMKDFWRVALLISMLSYPADVAFCEDSSDGHQNSIMKGEVFKSVEKAILRLGDPCWKFKFFCLKFKCFYFHIKSVVWTMFQCDLSVRTKLVH